LSADVTNIVEVAEACVKGGTDALSLINTLSGMAIDVSSRRPMLGGITGGLSGPCIRPIGVRAVWEVRRHLDTPILGGGGISEAEDALEFIIAGANAVAVGTANFVNPKTTERIVLGIKKYLEEHEIPNIGELSGSLCLE
jgi:dihydroorotate dehydrogenase (NAD+) catalytic subunit